MPEPEEPLERSISMTEWDGDAIRRHAELYESSGGTEGTSLYGYPVALLTTIGVKSGLPRKTPVMRIQHDDRYVLVASFAGNDTNPVWYHNVVANPHVMLMDGPVVHRLTARELSGEERDVWWRRAVEAYPPFEQYQQKTSRVIPVFILSRVE